MSLKTLPAFAALVLAGACASASTSSDVEAPPAAAAVQPTAPHPDQGIYAEAQAARGRTAFRDVCAECHFSSEFRDQTFRFKWRRRSVGDLYRDIVRNMPEDDPGSLSDQTYVDIVSYILELNGFPAGRIELPADAEVLAGYSMDPPGQSEAPPGTPAVRRTHGH